MKYMVKNHIKIGLVGHSYSRGNFGLCALAFGEQFAIEKACRELELDYSIICFETGINDPCQDNPNVKLEEYNLKNIFKTARQFSKCDLIIDITGGDSFSDIYGVKLFGVIYFIKAAIMLSGVAYISAPQTYGPFSRSWVKWISNFFLSKAEGIYGRDELSCAALTESNKKRIKCVADLGFALPYNKIPQRSKFTVGFNVNGLLYQSNNILGECDNYVSLCDEIICFIKSKGYDVVLVPHVVGEEPSVDNDYFVSVELAKKHGLEEPPFFYSPKDVKTYISQCHFFIGSRMHATIGAVSCGLPTLPLAYSRKFKGVYNSIDYNYTVDLNGHTNNEIIALLNKMMILNYNEVKADVNAARSKVDSKNKKYIRDIVSIIKRVF